MVRKTRWVAAGVVALGVIGAGAGVGIAAGNMEESSLMGGDYDRATAAALDHVGGGTVTEAEVGDGGAAYEVGVRLNDGSQIELRLDENFNVIAGGGENEATENGDSGEGADGD